MLVAYRWLCHHGGNWLREVFSCHDFILRAVATFWAMSLVGIYPGRASFYTEPITHQIGCGLKVFAKFVLPKIATVSIFPLKETVNLVACICFKCLVSNE